MNKIIIAVALIVGACQADGDADETMPDGAVTDPQTSRARDGAARAGDAQPSGDGGVTGDRSALTAPGGEPCTGDCRRRVLTAGRDHACVITAGSVQCWGRGEHGQLGDGVSHDVGVPTPVTVAALASPTQISAGQYHTCALFADGTVKCWGLNASGQLGDGTRTGRAEPVAASIAGAVQIAAGGDATCALRADGTIACWGYGTFGQLGNGEMKSSALPVPVSGVSDATQISLGTSVGCALLRDRTVKCWGYAGDDAARGIAIYNAAPVPIAITSALEIACGSSQACALLGDGTVKCWGEGNVGQLGHGQWLDSKVPVSVTSLSDVVQIAPGRIHICALLADRTIRCWGDGLSGQLGDGLRHDGFPTGVNTPVTVRLAGAVEIGSGGTYGCARLPAGRISCWGGNQYGQLGNGTFTSSLQP